MECKIVCDGKELGTIECVENGVNIKCTDEGKKLCCGPGCC